MANNPLPGDATVIASVNAVTVLLNSGFLNIYTGSQPALDGSLTGTLLVSFAFAATAFPSATASGGVVTATANPVSPVIAANSGTAGYFALLKSDDATVVATGTAGLTGSDLNLSTLSISAGQTVNCSSFAITQAQA